MQIMGGQHYPVQMFSDGKDDFMMDKETVKTTPGVAGCCNDNNVEKIYQLFKTVNFHSEC
jgi:hypothetical protein